MRPPVAVAVSSAIARGRLGDSYGDVRFLQVDIDNGITTQIANNPALCWEPLGPPWSPSEPAQEADITVC